MLMAQYCHDFHKLCTGIGAQYYPVMPKGVMCMQLATLLYNEVSGAICTALICIIFFQKSPAVTLILI